MNTIKLEKGIIHLMLPFRLGPGWSSDIVNLDNEIWTKTDEDIPKLDFLLEHVKEFFSKNAHVKEVDKSACLIMKLDRDALPAKMFNNKTYWLSNKSFDNQHKSKNGLKFSVYFDPGAFRIIFHPFTTVAILLYSIELVKSGKDDYQPNLADFVKMNYLLRLFNRHDEAFFISQNEKPEERNKANQLIMGKGPDLFGKDDPGNIELTGWRPRQMINYLLNGLNSRYKVEFFDHYHFSPVCYVQPLEEVGDKEIIYRSLFYLRKVYDFDYTLPSDILQAEQELIHPFKQIYYASSLEGAVVLNSGQV